MRRRKTRLWAAVMCLALLAGLVTSIEAARPAQAATNYRFNVDGEYLVCRGEETEYLVLGIVDGYGQGGSYADIQTYQAQVSWGDGTPNQTSPVWFLYMTTDPAYTQANLIDNRLSHAWTATGTYNVEFGMLLGGLPSPGQPPGPFIKRIDVTVIDCGDTLATAIDMQLWEQEADYRNIQNSSTPSKPRYKRYGAIFEARPTRQPFEYTAEVSWGDGSPVTTFQVPAGEGRHDVFLEHDYPDSPRDAWVVTLRTQGANNGKPAFRIAENGCTAQIYSWDPAYTYSWWDSAPFHYSPHAKVNGVGGCHPASSNLNPYIKPILTSAIAGIVATGTGSYVGEGRQKGCAGRDTWFIWNAMGKYQELQDRGYFYLFDWGDGTNTGWQYSSGPFGGALAKRYAAAGVYTGRVWFWDYYANEPSPGRSEKLVVNIANCGTHLATPPSVSVSGAEQVTVTVQKQPTGYNYCSCTILRVNWGDGVEDSQHLTGVPSSDWGAQAFNIPLGTGNYTLTLTHPYPVVGKITNGTYDQYWNPTVTHEAPNTLAQPAGVDGVSSINASAFWLHNTDPSPPLLGGL